MTMMMKRTRSLKARRNQIMTFATMSMVGEKMKMVYYEQGMVGFLEFSILC